jgi:hypothetical protein
MIYSWYSEAFKDFDQGPGGSENANLERPSCDMHRRTEEGSRSAKEGDQPAATAVLVKMLESCMEEEAVGTKMTDR